MVFDAMKDIGIIIYDSVCSRFFAQFCPRLIPSLQHTADPPEPIKSLRSVSIPHNYRASEANSEYLDFRSLAHLCAGIDYLFGPHGVLMIDVVSPGTGEPRGSYDPANPYIRIEPLPKPAG